MENNVKSFVDEYNKRIEWNKDLIKSILNVFDLETVSDELKDLFDDFLSVDSITEEGYDLEDANVYTYEDTGTLELQAFNNTTYRRNYFWVKPIGNEDDYKDDRLGTIEKVVTERLGQIIPELNKLTKAKNDFEKLKEHINKVSTVTETIKNMK